MEVLKIDPGAGERLGLPATTTSAMASSIFSSSFSTILGSMFLFTSTCAFGNTPT